MKDWQVADKSSAGLSVKGSFTYGALLRIHFIKTNYDCQTERIVRYDVYRVKDLRIKFRDLSNNNSTWLS